MSDPYDTYTFVLILLFFGYQHHQNFRVSNMYERCQATDLGTPKCRRFGTIIDEYLSECVTKLN